MSFNSVWSVSPVWIRCCQFVIVCHKRWYSSHAHTQTRWSSFQLSYVTTANDYSPMYYYYQSWVSTYLYLDGHQIQLVQSQSFQLFLVNQGIKCVITTFRWFVCSLPGNYTLIHVTTAYPFRVRHVPGLIPDTTETQQQRFWNYLVSRIRMRVSLLISTPSAATAARRPCFRPKSSSAPTNSEGRSERASERRRDRIN